MGKCKVCKTKGATFLVPGTGTNTATHCGTCKTPDMKSRVGNPCQHVINNDTNEVCGKNATFPNHDGTKKYMFCKTHSVPDTQSSHKKCTPNLCIICKKVEASMNTPEEIGKRYCVRCAPKDAVRKHKTCEHVENGQRCLIQPVYNFSEKKVGVFVTNTNSLI